MASAFIRRLKQAGPLSDLEQDVLLSLVVNPQDVAARQDIIGQHAAPVFLLMSGLACRYATLPDGTRRIAAFIIPGDLVGSSAGFTSGLPWHVGTLTRCSVAELSRPDLCTLTRTYPGIRCALRWLMQDELNRVRAWLLNDSQPSLQRVAHLLCELQARLEAVGLTGQGELSLSQADLADAAAISHVHVSRVLQTLFSERLVSLGHQKLTLTDVPRLRALAGFDPGYLAAGVAELAADDLLGGG
ncbi:Crp/Fnr family transcriptional regulator [Methylobacterium durans]|uniref:HTH crp-type domain-containing protein n=1 Tax=Methylobacterium durans TaxID=2202825 RepID=A0A2U8W390_9HYPH|nr:Crp/Fnr family transcriptional regulator [Methylobacterium durans]AWN39832.1 hypothetical protein DK389_03875 [Methylobacterium durans]